MRAHREMGQAQEQARRVKREERRAIRWMFRVLAASASVTFLALEVLFLRGDPLHWVFLSTALVLVAASAGLLVIAGLQEREYQRRIGSAGLVPGRIRSSDLGADNEVLRDQEWDLSGSPDYVMETDHGPVPVEVKTGHTPDEPYPSHVLQLGCYLRLLEATSGERPEYGLITYPEGVFRVSWDADLEDRVQQTLYAIQAATEAGRADRDHSHVGRCQGCARRSFCDQSLA